MAGAKPCLCKIAQPDKEFVSNFVQTPGDHRN
jgi:hypothetical protein